MPEEKIYKTFRAEIKSVDADSGEVDMLIPVSTDSVDRDGEIVEPGAFKKTLPKFMKRPVLVSSHDYRNLTSQIGEWAKLKIGENGLEGRPKYYIGLGNEQADWGFTLAQKGMAAFSIGFIPTKWQDGDGQKSPRRTYQEVELLEISQVIVPSNREAIQSIRSKGVDPVANKLFDDILADKELVTKPEETENYYRIPVPGEAGKHDDHKIRTMDVSKEKGVKGLYCVDDKKMITYMFDKEKWDSMEAARAWMMEHMGKYLVAETTTSIDDEVTLSVEKVPDTVNIYKKTSQESIIDEIDYLKSLISNGMNDATEKAFQELIKTISCREIKMNMGKMQEMHDMMESCEGMAKKAKKMSEDMMANEDHEDMEDKKRISGSDIPVKIITRVPSVQGVLISEKPVLATSKESLQVQDILESIKRIGGK